MAKAKHRGKHKRCPQPKKSCYTSQAQALRAGEQRYGSRGSTNAYECRCGKWHITRRGTPETDPDIGFGDDQLDHVIDVAFGFDDRELGGEA